MSGKLLIVFLALAIVGSLAAPEFRTQDQKPGDKRSTKEWKHKGGPKRFNLNLKSCVKEEAVTKIRKEILDCKNQFEAMTTTTTTTSASASTEGTLGGDRENRKKFMERRAQWAFGFACMIKKSGLILGTPKSGSDIMTTFAKNNFTDSAQKTFINATTTCLSKSSINVAELMTKTDTKIENWYPVMQCIHRGMFKSCEKKPISSKTDSKATTTEANGDFIEVEGYEDHDE